MERKRWLKSSSASDRLRSLLAVPSASQSAASPSFEIDESDLFDPSISPTPLSRTPTQTSNPNPNSSPVAFSRRTSFPRPPEGILAALVPATTSASVSSSPSSTSSSPTNSRMIPAIPKPKRDLPQFPQPPQYQSAPVNVPVVPSRFKTRKDSSFLLEEDLEEKSEEENQESENEMLPPHEMLARSRARESPLTTFSVLEGAGRTLKGRDLRQVRNAVWRRTGFQD